MFGVWLILLTCVTMVPGETCDTSKCKLPSCRCYNATTPPGNLELTEIPQIIMISMYGILDGDNIENYTDIFENLVNFNNCSVRGTFFVQDQDTNFDQLSEFIAEGHEIGIQSVNGMPPSTANEWIRMYTSVLSKLENNGIDKQSVFGVRAPGFSVGGTGQFQGIEDSGLLYDSSCASIELSASDKMIWPYTLDYDGPTCDIGSKPNSSFPGTWEVPVTYLYDLTTEKNPCLIPIACRNVTTKDDAYNILFNAFTAHYNNKKTPFNLIVDPDWAKNGTFREATIDFLEYVLDFYEEKVWVGPIHKALQWIWEPTPVSNLSNFSPWGC